MTMFPSGLTHSPPLEPCSSGCDLRLKAAICCGGVAYLLLPSDCKHDWRVCDTASLASSNSWSWSLDYKKKFLYFQSLLITKRASNPNWTANQRKHYFCCWKNQNKTEKNILSLFCSIGISLKYLHEFIGWYINFVNFVGWQNTTWTFHDNNSKNNDICIFCIVYRHSIGN